MGAHVRLLLSLFIALYGEMKVKAYLITPVGGWQRRERGSSLLNSLIISGQELCSANLLVLHFWYSFWWLGYQFQLRVIVQRLSFCSGVYEEDFSSVMPLFSFVYNFRKQI